MAAVATAAGSTALLTGVGKTPFVATWSRRIVSISLYAILFSVLVVSLPVTLPLALVIDIVGRRQGALTRSLLFFVVYLGCELVGIAASFGIWLIRGWYTRPDDPTFIRYNFRLQCWWARTLRRLSFSIFRLGLEIEGDEHTERGPLLMFVRHCSVADTMLPVMLVSDRRDMPLRWVMKRELLWDPCLDIVGNRLINCFVSRMPEEGAADVKAVATLMDNLGSHEGVVIYPEGTRFTPSKRRRLLAKAQERKDSALATRVEELSHTLPPRLGGALALLANNPGADALFCAHTGLDDFGRFGDLLKGKAIGNTVRIKMWRVPFADIPTNVGEQIVWLHDHWKRIDAFVGQHVGDTA